MRINFDFNDLEAFLAVAELGSFLRAAEQLEVSQSAITRRIKKLEMSLGVMLFERTTRSLKLTFAAKSFRTRAQVMIDEAVEARRAIGDDSDRFEYQRNAIITVATIPTSTRHILSRAIKSFRSEGLVHSETTSLIVHSEMDGSLLLQPCRS